MTRLRSLTFASITTLVLASGLGPGVEAQAGRRQAMLDPNLAGEQELAALPHMTPAIVKGLVDHRPFMTMTELDAFLTSSSLAAQQRADLYAKMFVHLNLNTATKEEILLIPGVGPRLLREFLEYRPYKALAQFRREIGKYVDDKELARLEQFVFVPVNLNTAADEDILSIPGVGRRLLREFKEYRPYQSLEQFRREIGKYVSKAEVARLARYVTID